MKSIYKLFFLGVAFALTSCEDIINFPLANKSGELVVEGWIIQNNPVQTIKLSLSVPYTSETTMPPPALGASVKVTNDKGRIFTFLDTNNEGNYTNQEGNDFGGIGTTFTLSITYNGENYESKTQMRNVPTIDSLKYEFRDDNSLSNNLLVEFYATDLKGRGDCYLIRSYKNNIPVFSRSFINIAYDGSFSANDGIDGALFIRPIRRSIASSFGTSEESKLKENDNLRVELYSISTEAYYFFQQMQSEISRQGGIFASIPNNVSSLIKNTNPSSKKTALGVFIASSLSSYQEIIDRKKGIKFAN